MNGLANNFTQLGGYKLCFNVYANGIGDDEDTHISVFVHLMKGEDDHHLQ